MYQQNEQVGWTDAQWNRVRQTVSEEAARGGVAASFLPIYGDLPRSTQVVPSERFDETNLTVDDTATAPLVELQSTITLSQAQVREADLSSALQLFRRATNILTRLQDWTIFNGKPELYGNPARAPAALPSPFSADGGEEPDWGEYFDGQIVGLTGNTKRVQLSGQVQNATWPPPPGTPSPAYSPLRNRSERMYNRLLEKNPGALGLFDAAYTVVEYPLNPDGLINGVVNAISALEALGHTGPFVCVLGTSAYQEAHRPQSGQTIFARDRIEPLIGRELLRSSAIDDRPYDSPPPPQDATRGLVLSLSGDATDLAVAADAEPEFLLVDANARYTFRVYERFALRVKQPSAIVALTSTVPAVVGTGITVRSIWADPRSPYIQGRVVNLGPSPPAPSPPAPSPPAPSPPAPSPPAPTTRPGRAGGRARP
jgi:uncharacterized linocin/CFP29 family protein